MSRPDPFITFYNGYYYGLFTESDRISIYRSTTLATIGNSSDILIAFTGNSTINTAIWSPELHHIGDRWYIFASGAPNSTTGKRLFYLVSDSDNPFSGYTFGGRLTSSLYCIDPTVLNYNGNYYISYARMTYSGSNNCYQLIIAPLDVDMTNHTCAIGQTTEINTNTSYAAWEHQSGGSSYITEAPAFLRHGEKIYLCYSANSTKTPQYALGLYVFDCASGLEVTEAAAWTKLSTDAPVFSSANGLYGPGHATFFTSPDGSEVWMAYHAKTDAQVGYTRYLCVQKISFAEDGTPVFGEPHKNLQIPPLYVMQ